MNCFNINPVPVPLVNLMAFVIPDSDVTNHPALTLLRKSTAGSRLKFMRAVTLVMEVPLAEQKYVRLHKNVCVCISLVLKAWIIDEIRVSCVGQDIVALSEDKLLIEASLNKNPPSNKNISYTRDLTGIHRAFFFGRYVCSNKTSIDIVL